MRSFLKLTGVELKLLLREPFTAFFTLVFPLMMLFLFGSIYGNKPSAYFDGYGSVDVSVPAYTAMIIATSGLLSLSITLASYREQGVLRRLQASPLQPPTLLAAHLTVNLIMTTLGMVLLILAAKLFYGLRFDGQVLSVAAAFILSCLSFFALGFVLGGLLPTARSAQVVGMVVFYPMIFLSGATLPLEMLPPTVRQVANFLPLTHVVTLLRGLWIGAPWSAHLVEVAVLSGMLLIGVLLSAKTFRWTN